MRSKDGSHEQFVLDDVEVYAHTFPEESFSVGVIGLNVISNYNVGLDFKERKILFEEYK